MNNIRNFAIIAHVDHGKSTLADRFLELTGVVKKGHHEEQLLDTNPISRERGITIKLAPVRMEFKWKIENGKLKILNPEDSTLNSQLSILNLIDTPGHVDFSYEVDRTLSCIEGVILLVDATQGIQAQTVANAYKALEKNLIIIPVVNKIDLPSAEVEKTKQELSDFIGIPQAKIFEISAKTGQQVAPLLEEVIKCIPSPSVSQGNDPEALIFDSYYDSHRGVIAFIRVFAGSLEKGMKAKLEIDNTKFEVVEVGYFNPNLVASDTLREGEIGYVVTNLKDIHRVRVGDTIHRAQSTLPPREGYRKINPLVFASVFTTDPNEYPNLQKALEKLYLNDSSLEFTPIYSKALGAGFRIGFLGMLHADVARERLEREYGLDIILTPPQVDYKFEEGSFWEPIVRLLIFTPQKYMSDVMELARQGRGRFITMDSKHQIAVTYEMPMSEMIAGFFDNLKSISSGFASLDWEFLRYEKVKADKLALLINGEPVEEFSEVVVDERAQLRAYALVKKMREVVPRQNFEIKIQASHRGKIIASERISPLRKDVTAKLYGGDRTRKDKLLKKQKEGKKKMKMVGSVEIPKEAFMKLFKNS